jgi:hypothetical protein
MNRQARVTLLVVWLGILLVGCSSTRPPVKTETAPPKAGVDESFDPVLLNDDELKFPDSAELGSVNGHSGSVVIPENTDNLPQANQILDGYRIQIFATKDIDVATRQKKEAEYYFANLGVGVYIDFDSPLYKVRIGDCKNREEAEALLGKVKEAGYNTAFIVKSRVNSIPILPETTLPEDLDVTPREN